VSSGKFRFERFELDVGNRQLRLDDAMVELNSRYFDALALLIGERGRLVSKDRFLEEVWRGVPVTDEALTQCIKTLRRQLGDDAANPRFIETVPKHGYRFIAVIEPGPTDSAGHPTTPRQLAVPVILSVGSAGGAVAGTIGGLVYGFAGAAQPLSPGMGAVSVVLVIAVVTIAMATLGAAGVSLGMALAGGRSWLQSVAGGAIGGVIVGAIVKLVGLDALNLLFGHAPVSMTGAPEGAALGAAIGLGTWLARRADSVERGMAWGGITGGVAGALIALLGGQMLAGSLDLLAHSFPGSRVQLDSIARLFGETGFGPVTRVATGAFEGLLFGACVVGAMVLARRRLGRQRSG